MKRNSLFVFACIATLSVAALFAVRTGSAQSKGEAYAIRGGTVVTVTGAVIQKGTVVVRNGLIQAVGADVPVPADARIVDATGMYVYPGLIDSHTAYGVRQETPAGGQGRGGGGAPPTDPAQFFLAQVAAQSAQPANTGLLPETSVVDQMQPVNDTTFDTQRAAGFTTALTAPRTGVFQGQSAIINLGTDAAEKLILKAPVTLNASLGSGRGFGGGYPGSPMGVIAFLRQSFMDAQHYREEWSRYNKNPRGMQRPQVNKSLAALQPIINGEMPLVITANSQREIERAVALAEEFKLKLYVSGAIQSYMIADWLKSKDVTVLLSLSYPQKPAGLEDPESESLRTLRERADAPKAAAALQKAGVRFAFTSGTLARPADFVVNAARAIEAGLPKDEALKAMTIYPAQIFGLSEQLGSIEKGKIANLIVTSGDLFARDTKVKHVFVDGKPFEIKTPETPQRPGGPMAGGPGGRGGGRVGGGTIPPESAGAGLAAGSWTLTVASPRGEMQMTARLQQSGESVTGELSLPFGAAPITKGSIKGNEIELEYSVTTPNGQTMTGTLKGKIDGASISGQMGMMGRNSDFTGSKTPKE